MNRLPRRWLPLRLLSILLAAPLLLGFIVTSRFEPLPQLVPIERLLANAKRRVQEEPGSAEAHYTVARLHYLVFSTGWTMADDMEAVSIRWEPAMNTHSALWHKARELAYEDVGAFGPHIPESKRAEFEKAERRRREQLTKSNWTPTTALPAAVMARHVSSALEELERASRLDPENAHYVLCQACLVEQTMAWSAALSLKRLPAELAGLDQAKARDLFLRAFRIGIGKNGPAAKSGCGADQTATYEAGQGFLRLANTPGPEDEGLRRVREEVTDGMKKMKDWPTDGVVELVTPIVCSLVPANRLSELVNPEARVDFNLQGFGPARTWSWLKPTTGLLVWDPACSGQITSGRQLFGSYTFQIVWSTGYAALASLDDDGDGVLRGAELSGIRVWFDRNGDGHSDATEVVDLAGCGIVGIVTRATATDGIHPTNATGLLMSDGRTLPTWDWMVEPVRN